jgi:hypothetical protein
MRRPWLVPTLVLLALLCVAASALAQDDEHFTPLLGPDSEGVRLEVRAEPDLVCIQLSGARLPPTPSRRRSSAAAPGASCASTC